MSKLLIITNGPQFVAIQIRKALLKYFDSIDFFGSAFEAPYKTDQCDLSEFKNNSIETQTENGVIYFDPEKISKYDFVLCLEHSSVPLGARIKKKFSHIVVGTQILDFPAHVFGPIKDYRESTLLTWGKDILPHLQFIDIFYHNKQGTLKIFEKDFVSNKHVLLRYPLHPIKFDQYERKDYIVFSGRIAPDKGIHYLIDALSILDKRIPLKIVGLGNRQIIKDYAEFLSVDCEIIENCSEHEKWKMYHECRFVVSAFDNNYCTSLCILEGISVGRLGICFDYEESRFQYDRFALYCLTLNIQSLASCIQHMYEQPALADKHAKDGPEWAQANLSTEKWALDVYMAYQERKNAN